MVGVQKNQRDAKTIQEKDYFPKFLMLPLPFTKIRSNETTPKRVEDKKPNSPQSSKIESFRFTETWSQLLEPENLQEFTNMDVGIYMNGNIMYLFFENFLMDAILGENFQGPAAVYNHGRILSVNNECLNRGIKKGMYVETSLDICKDMKLVKYDWDKVNERGLRIIRLLKKYTDRILSPQYNEFYLQISYTECRNLLETVCSNTDENICNLAIQISREVPGDPVIGIGKNMLVSKLASKRCRNLKINSQESEYDYDLSPVLCITSIYGGCYMVSDKICIVTDGFRFLNNVYLSEIPGVGYLSQVLKSKGLVTCNDVRKIGTPLCLQSVLGGRIGKLVYNFCFGYDYRCANLPKKQQDFFLNKSFMSCVTIGSQNSSISICDNCTQNSTKQNEPEKEQEESKSSSKGPSQETVGDSEGGNLERGSEERVLRKLLSKVLKDLCSVYSLFDKCIINYSIKYKCSVKLHIHSDTQYTKTITSILDKQSLRHTINSLYDKIKSEFGIEFSQIKKMELEILDVVRVEQDNTIIDKFLKERNPTSQESQSPFRFSFPSSSSATVTPNDSIYSPSEMCTPTRRLNGWKLDSISLDSKTPQSQTKSISSISASRTLNTPNILGYLEFKGQVSQKSNPDSSVDSKTRTPSRSRRSLKLSRGQKYITEYLSPSKFEFS
ncbi:uncharacterized protein TA15860 [Theileria annulata]|uniref:UmuC domain-containing protein n=1 Tax=Theileria annulata TaxID=5874 RepID=Q4UFQ5_THEAN|nr:uncharacterized protein TA15860 [Theileria annulata]CAI74061.1 hypothetical protein TA15860 [Theileria annulata]|eukprot:XP_951793.1 hypothetical protein TA15860 [Theileria annulata]